MSEGKDEGGRMKDEAGTQPGAARLCFSLRLPPSAFFLAIAMLSGIAMAQDYPNRPIRVVLSTPAGSTPDVTARLVAPGMSKLLGQQLVIDNRAGAGGLIGAEIVAKSLPDG